MGVLLPSHISGLALFEHKTFGRYRGYEDRLTNGTEDANKSRPRNVRLSGAFADLCETIEILFDDITLIRCARVRREGERGKSDVLSTP